MTSSSPPNTSDSPATMDELDEHRIVPSWFLSFSAAMVPFCAFCYGHSRGVTTRVVEGVVRSPGMYVISIIDLYLNMKSALLTITIIRVSSLLFVYTLQCNTFKLVYMDYLHCHS